MVATPFEQVLVEVAVKVTGEPTVLLAFGEVTVTLDFPLLDTVTVAAALLDPPQLSHATTVVL
jgi:hypothetical protein